MQPFDKLNHFNTFADLMLALPTDAACREYLEYMRWEGAPICPHCQCIEYYRLTKKGVFNGQYKCKCCKSRFNVGIGTMFEGSHIGYRKWFIAIFIFQAHKKGISSLQLHRDLGITQKSCWFMLHRIRHVFNLGTLQQFENTVEADETYIGGKSKFKHASKRIEGTQGRSTKEKTPVFGLRQRDGKVATFVVPDTKAATLKPIIADLIKKGSLIFTDESNSYPPATTGYGHQTVNHSQGEYVRGEVHTNTIEGFWSLLRRGIYGIYHQCSPKHLQAYCDEFEYRYNERKITDRQRFDTTILQTEKGHLTYKQLIGKG